jgi:hypothetical protein
LGFFTGIWSRYQKVHELILEKKGVLAEDVVYYDKQIQGKDAQMEHGTDFTRQLATAERIELANYILDKAWEDARPALLKAICIFLANPISPNGFYQLENFLLLLLRNFGRSVLEALLNSLEPATCQQMPHDLQLNGAGYRVLRDKTANRFVATLFGTLCLMRRGYRYWHAGVAESVVFPLEMSLGLVESVSPALQERIGRQMAEAGATQDRVLHWVRSEHGVAMGVKRLRELIANTSQRMSEFQLEVQLEQLLGALKIANESSGNRKPVLSVGRDGITLREYHSRFYEVAAVATLSVFDRAGNRLTTVYLAHTPEPHQVTMSRMLSELIVALLLKWDGPLPQLAYVADSGGNESTYYETTLQRMTHPRTGIRLPWQRVVDYYHAAERIWTMAECLFGSGTQMGHAWARRMLKNLKKSSGASRVLHSAGAMRARRTMSASALKKFNTACNYIRKRTKYMQYDSYKARHIPLGSGITEAACKTVFAQRLKLSGMRWTAAGAKNILNLRTCLLSKSWEATFAKYLNSLNPISMAPYQPKSRNPARIVA